MDQAEIIDKVIGCVVESLAISPEGIHARTKIISDLGADSLDFMDIIFQLETTFGVSLQKEDFDLFFRTGMKKEEALENGLLSNGAKEKLRFWLPDLPMNLDLRPSDLSKYVSIETVGKIIVEHKNTK